MAENMRTREQHAADDPRPDPSPEFSEGKAAGASSSCTTPGHGLVLKLQLLHLQPARETESAHSIPAFIPATCHGQTCAAVHKQMSFDNSEKTRRGRGMEKAPSKG